MCTFPTWHRNLVFLSKVIRPKIEENGTEGTSLPFPSHTFLTEVGIHREDFLCPFIHIGLYIFLVIWTIHKLRGVNDAYGIKGQLGYCVCWAIWGLAFGVTQNLMNRNLYVCLFLVMSLGLIYQTLLSPAIRSYGGRVFNSDSRSIRSSFIGENELNDRTAHHKRTLTVTQLNINLEDGARNFEPATLASNTIKTLTLQRDASDSQVHSKSRRKSRRRARGGVLSALRRFSRHVSNRIAQKPMNNRHFESQLKQLRLIDVFRDVEMLEVFLEHIKREFSVENYLFYCVTKEFERLCERNKFKTTEERNSRAAEIYCKFVNADSDLQVSAKVHCSFVCFVFFSDFES